MGGNAVFLCDSRFLFENGASYPWELSLGWRLGAAATALSKAIHSIVTLSIFRASLRLGGEGGGEKRGGKDGTYRGEWPLFCDVLFHKRRRGVGWWRAGKILDMKNRSIRLRSRSSPCDRRLGSSLPVVVGGITFGALWERRTDEGRGASRS